MSADKSISHLTENFDGVNIIDESVSCEEENECDCEIIFPADPDNGKKNYESNDESEIVLQVKRVISDEQNFNEDNSTGNCNSRQRQSKLFVIGSQLVIYVGHKDAMFAMLFSLSIVISMII